MRQVLIPGDPISRIAVMPAPAPRTLAVMLSSARLTAIASKPSLRATTSIHSRVRVAVFPARSIRAPNRSSTSTASLDAEEPALSSRSEDEVTPVSMPMAPPGMTAKCHVGPGSNDTRPAVSARASLVLLQVAHPLPAAARIERLHGRDGAVRLGSEILLVEDALVIDEERHHAGIAVLRRIGHQREAADQLAARDVIQRSPVSALPLAGQNLVVVAVIGHALVAGAITLRRRTGGKVAERALILAGLRRPVQAVLLARPADDALRVDPVPGDSLLGIFVLCVDIGETGLDGAQFVAADAAKQDLLAPGGRVELPCPVLTHERNGKREVILPDDQDCLVVALHGDPVFGVIGGKKLLPRRRVGDRIAGRHDVAAVAAE